MAQTLHKVTCHPVPEWQGQSSWRVLDCSFGHGPSLFATLLQWHQDPHRPRMLHYVGLAPEWSDLAPGFHRFSLAHGQVVLTLCVGDALMLLREQSFAADSIALNFSSHQSWDNWHFKALARCCRRGTTLATTHSTPEHLEGLKTVGFEFKCSSIDSNNGIYSPGWSLKTSRQPWHKAIRQPGRCIVLGAGLAGAGVAQALALRGWQVQVIDAAPQPAAGASALPAGLVEPHVSKDDNPRSRLSRSGVQLTFHHARRWLKEGTDWAPSGILNVATQTWQANAAWIKPERLVQAWLSQPGVTFIGNTHIAAIAFDQGQWQLRDAQGKLVAQTELLVLACATQVASLLQASGLLSPAYENVAGGVNWGWQSAALSDAMPTHPVNGKGSLIPGIPQAQGLAWYVGATYETHPRSSLEVQAENDARLKLLWPQGAAALQDAPNLWQGERCVSKDKLPMVGCLMEGLWTSMAMGSRGLTFAALCAELLAAELGGEPLPVQSSLAKVLRPWRAAEQTR